MLPWSMRWSIPETYRQLKDLQWLGKDPFIDKLSACNFQQIKRQAQTGSFPDTRWLRRYA